MGHSPKLVVFDLGNRVNLFDEFLLVIYDKTTTLIFVGYLSQRAVEKISEKEHLKKVTS